MKSLSGYLTLLCILVVAVGAGAQSKRTVTCGDKITAPGDYWLSSDCKGDGIEITASDVHLFMNGHTLTSAKQYEKKGISVFNAANVAIIGPGKITAYSPGIFFDSVKNSKVLGISSAYNAEGIHLYGSSTGNRIVGNYTYQNCSNGSGIGENTSNNHVEANAANYNRTGISVKSASTENEIRNNIAWDNPNGDLDDANPNCDHNDWGTNSFAHANIRCIE